MPFIKVYMHLVWSTKNREPYLRKEIRSMIFDHIKENATKKGIFLDTIGGYTDHMHALVSLSSDQSISKVIQLIKGESSNWINKQDFQKQRFEWQDEYFAVSVSPSQLTEVRNYIKTQEFHHQKITFQEEYDQLLKESDFSSFRA